MELIDILLNASCVKCISFNAITEQGCLVDATCSNPVAAIKTDGETWFVKTECELKKLENHDSKCADCKSLAEDADGLTCKDEGMTAALFFERYGDGWHNIAGRYCPNYNGEKA